MKTSKHAPFQILVAVTALLSLAACGGGGGGGGTAAASGGAGGTTTPAATSNTLGSYCKPLFATLTPGTTWEVVLQGAPDASTTITTSMNASIGSLTYQTGNPAYPATMVLIQTTNNASGVTTLDQTTTAYNYPTATDQVTQYGDIATSSTTYPSTGGAPVITTSSVSDVYTPAFVDNSYALTAGQSIKQRFTHLQTVTGSATTSTINVETTVTFVDVEPVTVAAGTFQTCRVDTTTTFPDVGVTSTLTEYVVVGYGVPVRTISGGTTMEATSVKVNGVTLQ